MAEQMFPVLKEECPVSISTQTSNCYDIVLDEDIQQPHYYRNAFQALREAREGDLVRIFICSSGGSLSSAIQFKNYIDECQGHVVAIVDGEAYSAASMIALCAHEIHVKPFSTWMLHSASFGAIGNTENVKAQVDFTAKHADAFMEEVYKDFVSSEELNDIRRGVEIWLDAEQVNERLSKKFSKFEDDYEGQDQISIDDIIASAAEDAAEKTMKKILAKFDLTEKVKPVKSARKKVESKLSSPEMNLDPIVIASVGAFNSAELSKLETLSQVEHAVN